LFQNSKRQGLTEDNKQTPFQKLNRFFNNYNKFKSAVEDKLEQVKVIQKEGLPKKSKSITSWGKSNT